MPLEYWRWQIAREFGWTLPQVDALSMEDFTQYFQVRDGIHKAQEMEARKSHGRKGR
jgi:hypothetical protein